MLLQLGYWNLDVSNNFRMINDLRKREIIMEKKSETLFSERKLQGLKDRIFVFTLKYVHTFANGSNFYFSLSFKTSVLTWPGYFFICRLRNINADQTAPIRLQLKIQNMKNQKSKLALNLALNLGSWKDSTSATFYLGI